jgi:hypothetical protein
MQRTTLIRQFCENRPAGKFDLRRRETEDLERLDIPYFRYRGASDRTRNERLPPAELQVLKHAIRRP